MFESLQERLGSILNGLTGRGALSEADVSAALREVRRALIEADVALEVVRSFTDKVRAKAVGAEVLKSIKPGQMVVKIVHDELVEMLGSEGETIDLNAPAPVVIMMVGLQGSGKTTTSAKIAKRLTERSTSWPIALSRTPSTKSFTTGRATSASSSATRTSRSAAFTSASLSAPRRVSWAKTPESRSCRLSNIAVERSFSQLPTGQTHFAPVRDTRGLAGPPRLAGP